MSKKKTMLLGAHISIAGGYHKAITRAESINCTTMQVFTKSNKTWFAKKILEKDAQEFKKALKQSHLSKIMAHSAYLINLGSKNVAVRKKSIKSLIEEVERCEILNIPYLVLHPGAHLGSGEEKAITLIADGLDAVLKATPGTTTILLETAAGQGTTVGYTFQQLKAILTKSKKQRRLAVCLDTCHIFAAGYDISTQEGYTTMWKAFKKIIGLQHLKAIHLNDSKSPLDSRVDRHEKIGKGYIPLKTFNLIMNDRELVNIPKVLETPIIKDALAEYNTELSLLRKMIH